MRLDLAATLDKVCLFNLLPEKASSNFFNKNETEMDAIRAAIIEATIQLWWQFKNKNMFDFQNHDNLSFPFVLTNIVASNLIFMKDNVISSNEINMFG